MYRAYGTQQPALNVMEGLENRHSQPESHLSWLPRRRQVSKHWKRLLRPGIVAPPQINRSGQSNWTNQATFFAYPADIHKVFYTTNAIESLNSVIRHAIRKHKVFPTDESVKKVGRLAIQAASQKWTMSLKDWRMAMSRFIIEFSGRFDGHF